MDDFFITYLSDGRIVVIAIALAIAGALAVGRFTDITTETRRVAFLWQAVGLRFAVLLSGLTWFLAEAAVQAGIFWVLTIVNFGFYFFMGAAWYAASSARSNHIIGSTSRAWLGFVPLVAAYLFFAPKRKDRVPNEAPTRNPAMRFVADPLLVIGAIIAVAFLGFFQTAVDRAAEAEPTSQYNSHL